jgi:hypothetical protein
MALALTTITNSLAALSVSGVTIRDLDEVEAVVQFRGTTCILQPEPVDFMTNPTFTIDAFQGATTTSPAWRVEYDLRYTLFYSPIGTVRNFEAFGELMAKAMLIWDAVLTSLVYTGAVKITPAGIITPGVVLEPGTPDGAAAFFGCHMTFHVLEFVN